LHTAGLLSQNIVATKNHCYRPATYIIDCCLQEVQESLNDQDHADGKVECTRKGTGIGGAWLKEKAPVEAAEDV
jgi:hypothetical protein